MVGRPTNEEFSLNGGPATLELSNLPRKAATWWNRWGGGRGRHAKPMDVPSVEGPGKRLAVYSVYGLQSVRVHVGVFVPPLGVVCWGQSSRGSMVLDVGGEEVRVATMRNLPGRLPFHNSGGIGTSDRKLLRQWSPEIAQWRPGG
jgi:hypothetical protein